MQFHSSYVRHSDFERISQKESFVMFPEIENELNRLICIQWIRKILFNIVLITLKDDALECQKNANGELLEIKLKHFIFEELC